MGREESPAFLALDRRALRVLAAIEAAIGDGSEATVSYLSLMHDHHIDRRSISPGIKQLVALGLVDIRPGPRLGNVFELSRRWLMIDAAAAARLSEAAREVKACRTFEKRRAPVEPVQESEPVAADKPAQLRRPSMPTLAWLGR